ncbi:MAG: LLM class flavin-dependent oxidoreductase [Acidimicrobiia bacterium]
MKVGITLPSFVDDPAVPLTVARVAEESGVDGVFVYDHLFRRNAAGERRPALEGISLLGAVAAATHQICVGTLVLRASLRPPASLAAAIGTVASLAPGRVIAGIGAGDSESKEENETFGLGFGTVEDRLAVLADTVAAVRDRGATVWVGGGLEEVRRIAAETADGWNRWGGQPDAFAAHVAEVRAAARRSPCECSWGGLVVLDTDDDAAAAKAARLGAPSFALVGGPATIADHLATFAAAGADWVIVAPVDASDPENARRLGREVRPLLPTDPTS